MNKISLEDKQQRILEYEESRAHKLARLVLEKPVPPIWMILIPIFFVFHAQKIKEYSKGLKDFADHYMVSRRRALETALSAIQSGREPDITSLTKLADTIPTEAKPLYSDWITALITHYHNLLNAKGASVEELTRSHYKNKSNYLLVCNHLNAKESAFNSALLPNIDGDSQDILFIAGRLKDGITTLHNQEIETLFP